ncbi:MAG: TfoX protein [Clostridiales bacterium]|jgi:DNA transformation protein|nr:TfoX protein [Clostridiales bacterium]
MYLSDLINISEVIEEKLVESGIETPERLKELGSKLAFVQMREKYPTACKNILFALEGAIQGIRWFRLTDEEKDILKDFFSSL